MTHRWALALALALVGCGSGDRPLGASCGQDDECASGRCGGLLTKNVCVCATDTDCPAGKVCRFGFDSGPFCLLPADAGIPRD